MDSTPAEQGLGPVVPLVGGAVVGGDMTAPLNALLRACADDSVPAEGMPAMSGGLVFTFGLGAILGPLAVGFAMDAIGPFAFWLVLGGTFAAITVYALYRMSQTEAIPASQTEAYVNIVPTASIVAVEDATNWAVDNAEAEETGP